MVKYSFFKSIGWILVILVTATSLFFTLSIGHSFEIIKSCVWMSAVLLTLTQFLLFYKPLKVFIKSLFNTYVKKESPSNYELKTGFCKDLDKNEFDKLKKYCTHLNSMLRNCYYEPMTEKEEQIMRKRALEEDELIKLLFDLIFYIFYLLLLGIIVFSTRDKFNFYSSRHIEDQLVNGKYTKYSMDNLVSNEDVQLYLKYILIPTLHNGKDHSDVLIDDGNGWLDGKTVRMLGISRLRQLRIHEKNCTTLNGEQPCYPEYTSGQSDERDFNVGWKQKLDSTYDKKYWRITDPWKLRDSWNLKSNSLYGVWRSYPGSGYASQLGRSRNNSKKILKFLEETNWIDHKTRVVFIEVTFFTMDASIFNVVSLILERNSFGKWTTSHEVHTTKPFVTFFQLPIVITCFLVLTSILLIRIIFICIEMKSWNYFKNLWNSMDLVIVVLTVSYIVTFYMRSEYVVQLLDELHQSRNNEFVSFYWATQLDIIVDVLSGLLISIATIRMWHVLNYYETFRLLNRTLAQSAFSLLSITFMMAIFLIGFCSCIRIINGANSEAFSTFFKTLTSITALSFGFIGSVKSEDLMNGGGKLGIVLYIVLMISINILLLNMFITIVCVYFQNTKNEVQPKRKVKIWKLVKKRIKAMFGYPEIDFTILHKDYTISRSVYFQHVINAHFECLEKYLEEHPVRQKKINPEPMYENIHHEFN